MTVIREVATKKNSMSTQQAIRAKVRQTADIRATFLIVYKLAARLKLARHPEQ